MRIFIAFFITLLAFSCQNNKAYQVDNQLSVEEQLNFKNAIIRYVAPVPKKATYETRFEERFDDFYEDQVEKHQFDFYFYDEKSGRQYFSLSRVAPSLYEKKVAVTGYVVLDDKNDILDYEEIYRTWKMKPEELSKKNLVLFETLVTGGDLSPYYIENNEEEWIEFPDAKVAYDKVNRKWELRNFIEGEERASNTIIRP